MQFQNLIDPKIHEAQSNSQTVEVLPYPIERGAHFRIEGNNNHGYTHSLFTFPAKFHTPIVKWSLQNFSKLGHVVLDPYAGSGTVQVEALLAGRASIGIDVDVVANFISTVKCTPINPKVLRSTLENILEEITPFNRGKDEYFQRRFPSKDISLLEYEMQSADLWVPSIDNIFHWFRKYVIVDLAHIRNAIQNVKGPSKNSAFFMSVFAAILRRC